jgi:hypothetical protein
MTMNPRRFLWILAVAMLVPAVGQAQITDEERARWDSIREQVEAHFHVQMILAWYTRTQGESSIQEKTYVGRESLYTEENIRFIEGLIGKAEGADEERRLRFLRDALLMEYVYRQTASFDDAISNAESVAEVTLEWIPDPVPYRELDGMLDNETDPDKRQKLQNAQTEVWRTRLNPLHEEKQKKAVALVEELGYDYVTLSEQVRFVNLREFIPLSREYIGKTDRLYRDLFAEHTTRYMGIQPEEFTRAEIGRLLGAPQFDAFFPPELAVLSFKLFLEGIGIDYRTAAGTEIVLEDSQHPKKHPRAACFAMVVPSDIRMTVKPTGGIQDFQTLFHEGGHAIHFANTTVPHYELQVLGNNTGTETFAEFFDYVWGDPVWLKRYREIVKNYNKYSGKRPVPVMTDEDIGRVVRQQVLMNLYFVRRYGGAKLLYETILHGGAQEIYEPFYDGPTDDLQEVYRVVFGEAYGFELKPHEALRFRTDVDSYFYSADYARAYIGAMQCHEAMRKMFGEDWYENEKVGAFLKENLFRDGCKLQGEEISKILGYDRLDYEAFDARIRRVLAESEALIAGD